MDFEPQQVTLSSAQVLTIVPSVDQPRMNRYTVESLDELLELRFRLTDPNIGEFIVDIEAVHWDESPDGPLED